GGEFTSAGGVSANRIAQWNETNVGFPPSAWSALGPGFNDRVLAIERFNNLIHAAGQFTLTGDKLTSVNRIAQWNGTAWLPLGTGGADGAVRALLSENANLYAAGDFTHMGGIAATHFARWNGTAWTAVRGGTDGTVSALAAYHNEVHAGGSFLNVRSAVISSPGWARYLEAGAPWIDRQPSSATVACNGSVSFSAASALGYGGLMYQWRKDGVPLSDGPTG